jgi:hypothetical protein
MDVVLYQLKANRVFKFLFLSLFLINFLMDCPSLALDVEAIRASQRN